VLLNAAGDVHRVAHRRELRRVAHRAEQDRTGVDPDPQGYLHGGIPAVRWQRVLERQRRMHGPLRIILPRRVSAPHRHDRVADVLVDATAVLDDRHVEPRPDLVHQLGDQFRVHALRHRGEAAHVGEQNRRLPAPPCACVE
jgi:hypothetical protein